MSKWRWTGALVAAAAIAVPAAWSALGQPARQGIVVHGKWQLVVKSHGKVVRVRRFENALASDGAKALIRVLGRQNTVGRWSVELNGSNPNSTAHPCNNAGIQFCWISAETDTTFNGFIGPVSRNMTATVDTTTPELLLKGSITATADATIGQVVSGIMLCNATSLATDCKGAGLSLFTVAGVNPGVPVSNGQQVAITVHFTFS